MPADHILPMPPRLFPGPFTRETYHRLGAQGVLDEDARVELLDGQIVEMSPIGARHAICVAQITTLLARRTGPDVTVSPQNPLPLAERWEPQPDVVVFRRAEPGAGLRHPDPSDVLLIVEVADTSLERDRDVKIPRYAAAGIPEVWLVDLASDTIAVYRRPGPDGYAGRALSRRGDTLHPAVLAGVAIGADEILG